MARRTLRSYFSFGGVLDRRAYAWRYLIAFAALIGAGVAVFLQVTLWIEALDGVGAIDPRLYQSLRRALVPLTVLVVMPPYTWVYISLCWRRWRDIGVNPLLGVGAAVAISFADSLLLKPHIAARYFPPWSKYTPIGGALLAIIFIILFAWPGRPRAGRAAATTQA